MRKIKSYLDNLEKFLREHKLTLIASMLGFLIILGTSSFFKDSPDFTQTVSPSMANLSTFGLFIVSIIALEIIKTTKREAEVRYKRDAAQAALTQIERFKNNILPSQTFCEILNIPAFDNNKIRDFYKEELDSLGVDYGIENGKYIEPTEPKTPEEKKAALQRFRRAKMIESAINETEIFSFAIMSGVSDGEIMFPVCSNVFCSFVEQNYIHYCDSRNQNGRNLYKHTIDLYRTWSTKSKRDQINGKIKGLIKEYEVIPDLNTKIIGRDL